MTSFNGSIENTNNFDPFRYKANILENTVSQNEILKNVTIFVPLKYLRNFWRSLEMPLINCKTKTSDISFNQTLLEFSSYYWFWFIQTKR